MKSTVAGVLFLLIAAVALSADTKQLDPNTPIDHSTAS